MTIFQVPVEGEVTATVGNLPLILSATLTVTVRAQDEEEAALLSLDALNTAECSGPRWRIDLDNVTEVSDEGV